MRILVSGGCGFVGSAVVRAAVKRGDTVLNLDRRRRTTPCPALASIAAHPRHARLEANLSDRVLIRAVIREFAPDAVIHLAAGEGEDPDQLMATELGGALSILEGVRSWLDICGEAARASFRIVGLHKALGDAPAGLTPAEAMRSAASKLMEQWALAHDLPLVTCIAGEAFGAWQHPDSVLGRWLSALLDGHTVSLAEGGRRIRDWIPVRDLAVAILLAAERGARLARIDVSVGAERRDIDVAEFVCAMLDERWPREGSRRSGLIRAAGAPGDAQGGPMLDPMEAEALLGWRPEGFHAGVERMLSWAVEAHRNAGKPASSRAAA